MKKTLKHGILNFCNCYDNPSSKAIGDCAEVCLQEFYNLKPYDGSLLPGITKGHWKSENTLTIYNDECNLPQGAGSLRIRFSKYGIKDTEMFYTVDGVELNPNTREQDREAAIWADINKGIYNKVYR